MMIHRFFFLVCSFFFLLGCASERGTPNRRAFELQWEIAEQRHAGGNETLSWPPIQNTSADRLAADGWATHFNGFGGPITGPDSGAAKIKRINGDFFTLQPLPGWQPLAPDSAIQLPIVTRVLRNITDIPTGFYLVSERYPDGISVPFTQ